MRLSELIFNTAYAQTGTYKDYLKIGCDAIPDCIKLLLDYALRIAFPLAVVFIILSGLLFVTAQGDTEKLKRAKMMLTFTVIGIAIIVGAWALAVAFQSFFKDL